MSKPITYEELQQYLNHLIQEINKLDVRIKKLESKK